MMEVNGKDQVNGQWRGGAKYAGEDSAISVASKLLTTSYTFD